MTGKLPPGDATGIAQQVALEIMELDPGRRAEAVAEAGDTFAALAETEGCSPVDAAVLAMTMRQRIEEAMRAIEADGKIARSHT